MSRALETYLVKLYLDRDARRTFLDDPRGAAPADGLDEEDVATLGGRWARLVALWRRWRTRP